MDPRPTTLDLAAARTPDAGGTAAGPAPAPGTQHSPRRPWRGLALVGTLALLAACASTPGSPGGTDDATTGSPTPTPAPTLELAAGSSVVGLPDDLAAPPVDATAGAARTADGALIYVITYGSSTCPSIADPSATGPGDGTVAVAFAEPGDGPCTMDWVPATTVVALPDGVASDGDLAVTIGDLGSVTLPAGSQEPVWVIAEG